MDTRCVICGQPLDLLCNRHQVVVKYTKYACGVCADFAMTKILIRELKREMEKREKKRVSGKA